MLHRRKILPVTKGAPRIIEEVVLLAPLPSFPPARSCGVSDRADLLSWSVSAVSTVAGRLVTGVSEACGDCCPQGEHILERDRIHETVISAGEEKKAWRDVKKCGGGRLRRPSVSRGGNLMWSWCCRCTAVGGP